MHIQADFNYNQNPDAWRQMLKLKMWVVFCFCLIACEAMPETRYVVPPGTAGVTPGNGFTNWACAATTIVDAVSGGSSGDTIWLTNGNYYRGAGFGAQSRILRSVNGRDFTFVNGGYPDVTGRPFTLNHPDAVVEGVTISNCYSPNSGGAVYMAQGTLRNCSIIGNRCVTYGGGVYAEGTNTFVYNCIIRDNIASNDSVTVQAGGVYIGGVMSNCIITMNRSWGPSSAEADGGGVAAYGNAIIRNCLIVENRAEAVGFGGGVMSVGGGTPWFQNCTIASNYATLDGGGIYNANLENSIVYFNTAGRVGSNCFGSTTNYAQAYNSCTAPLTALGYLSSNNIDSNPQFVGFSSGNYRLTRGSLCINSGMNQDWMNQATDLDQHRRLDRFSGHVDMGAYEYLFSGNIVVVH